MSAPRDPAQLAAVLVVLQDELRRAGLHATATRLESAVRMVGWELAGDVMGCLRDEAAQTRRVWAARGPHAD